MPSVNRTKLFIKLKRVLLITLSWVLIGIFFAFYDIVIIDESSGEVVFKLSEDHDLLTHLIFSTVGPLIGGLIGGSIIIFYLKDRFRQKSLGYYVLVSATIYFVLIYLIVGIASLFYYSSFLSQPMFGPEVLSQTGYIVTSLVLIKYLVLWFLIVLGTLLVLQISDKYGPGVLWNFILGKYHHPQQETRIFMFADIKSSTSIAEELGNIKYFDLLNDFFNDITDPVLYSRGEIYQYVGDEVVISWTLKNGLVNVNCVRCFYQMKKAIQNKQEWYNGKYGLVPDFKAGLHFGEVTIGEIGIIKKDIVFSGDVLNTTARIQSVCNSYQQELIISKALWDQLSVNHRFESKEIGKIELRGKQQKVSLLGVKEVGLLPAI